MPEICRFYGIVIKMFFKPKEHEPSHLHALYGEHIGIFDLKTMKMTEGDLPTRAQQLVQEWMSAHQDTARRKGQLSVETLEQICRGLGISWSEFFAKEDEQRV